MESTIKSELEEPSNGDIPLKCSTSFQEVFIKEEEAEHLLNENEPTLHPAEDIDPINTSEGNSNLNIKPLNKSEDANSNIAKVSIQNEAKKKLNFVCSECQKSFKKFRGYTDHMKTHSGAKHKCTECTLEFLHASSLKRHQLRHIIKEKPLKCEKCEREFYHQSDLKKHESVHTEEKQFACSICFKSFSRKTTLKKHIEVHVGLQKYQCFECQKTFWHPNSLKRHYLLHTNIEKSFACNECGKSFYRNCDLTKHKKTHSEVKPFPCHLCSKQFIHASNLRIHYQIHNEEKTFHCNTCMKSFKMLSTLVKHNTSNKHKRLVTMFGPPESITWKIEPAD